MKLNQMAMANAFGVVAFTFYLGCYLTAMVSSDLYRTIAQSWFHMMDLSSLWKSGPSNLLVGLVSFTIVAWVSGWILAMAYNSFAKK